MKQKNKDKSIRKLAISAVLSVMLALSAAVAVFCFFFVDLGQEREIIAIPDFVGIKAEDALDTDKVRLERELVFSESAPIGVVISQEPYAGARRKLVKGERYTVRLTVSMGRETYSIPDLCGYTSAEAKIALRKLGATVRIVYVYDGDAPRDTVLSTSPAAGESVEPYDKVTLFVSRDRIEMPVKVRDFCGMNKEAACAEILADGLVIGNVTEEYRNEGKDGTVIFQSLAVGSYVKRGSTVDIVVLTSEIAEAIHPFGRYITEENGEINGSDD